MPDRTNRGTVPRDGDAIEPVRERRNHPTISLLVGKRHYGLDSLKGLIVLGSVITLIYGAIQFGFKIFDMKVGRGTDAKIAAILVQNKEEARIRAYEDSLSRAERHFLLQQNEATHNQIQGLTLVVCAAVSDKSSTLTRIKCDEALRAAVPTRPGA